MNNRLDALETAYIRIERPNAPLHVASVGFFEAAPFFDEEGVFKLEELRAAVMARMGLAPKLRQRLAEVPLELGRPIWVDDDAFDIANHVAVEAVPAPGDHATVMDLLTQRYSELLDHAHPLWHMLFLTGEADGRVVLLERVHHAVADGVGGVGLASLLLDLEPTPAPVAYPPLPDAAPAPGSIDRVRAAIVDRTRDAAITIGAGASTALHHPLHMARRVNETLGALSGDGHGVFAPPAAFNAPLGDHRRLLFAGQRLDEFKKIGDSHGATVNDVVLAVVTAAARALLLERGERLDADAIVKILVPVSFRRADQSTALGNEVAGFVVPLPIGIGDPLRRLATITETMQAVKASGEAGASMVLLELADLLPPLMLHGAHLLMDHQPLVNLVVTNVPGPPVPLYVHGAKMLDAFPIVPLAGNLTLGVAVLSYNGALNFGVTVDPDVWPDADVFVRALDAAVDALA
ncbi:MAG TPA: wax ester/triacylglycerol synthase family O-acyltransferase [Acidimicrobiales bacterium]|nr:wax ester/triacylglycerol synthase family O-acyltransferase [Acidimicrobiales bacterium]